MNFLPITLKEFRAMHEGPPDCVIVSGDAYVDHPSFGHAVIARLAENMGLKTAVMAQPNWRDDLRDFKKFGRPAFFFAVTSGNMDSMVNHYTAAGRRRSNDAFTPGGQAGFRPDYAVSVYTGILKKLFPEVPVIIGGIEASLRRITHYDYWSNSLMPSILSSCGAGLLVYGPGERPMAEIIRLLKRGVPFTSLRTVPQTAFFLPRGAGLPVNKNWDTVYLPSDDECRNHPEKLFTALEICEREYNSGRGKRLVQETDSGMVLINPPFSPASEADADLIYSLPYARLPHPAYRKRGPVPAYEMIRFSVNSHRGCFGGCAFCSISAHQGRRIISRSVKSVVSEVEKICALPDFRGVLSDVGGPSANMYGMGPADFHTCGECARPSCLHPSVCPNLDLNHDKLLELYSAVASLTGIKKFFVSSGLRYDIIFGKNGAYRQGCSGERFMEELVRNHVPGRIKLAPEHASEKVLRLMRKPSFSFFRNFLEKFRSIAVKAGMKHETSLYLMCAHPGTGPAEMRELGEALEGMDVRVEQVQEFTPLPMTLSGLMYHTGLEPSAMKEVYVARSTGERRTQKNIILGTPARRG